VTLDLNRCVPAIPGKKFAARGIPVASSKPGRELSKVCDWVCYMLVGRFCGTGVPLSGNKYIGYQPISISISIYVYNVYISICSLFPPSRESLPLAPEDGRTGRRHIYIYIYLYLYL